MDKTLTDLLNKHLRNCRSEFKRIPKSNKHKGMMAAIQNLLEDKKRFAEKADKIVNREHGKMVDYINNNLLDNYSDEELDNFMEHAKDKFTELLQDGMREA